MLNIEQIIDMAKQMNINVSEELEGKHYVLDDEGKRVPFQTSMLIDIQSQIIHKECFKVNFHKNCILTDLEDKYIISDNCSSFCFSEPMDVEQSSSLVA
ncbi:MAG: hypothetical protein N4A64_08175 [Marinisporobacter sp.]|jgi:hypothetical protein|nr:hypothetical protein [Marinisporobacter sp.]